LRLSELYRWREVLDVPLMELLVEPSDELTVPLLCRTRLVRLMKSARAIEENTVSKIVKRLALSIIDQLVKLMPELAAINVWHSVGQRRGANELGRIVERQLSEEQFQCGYWGD